MQAGEDTGDEKAALHLAGQLLGVPYFSILHSLRWRGQRNVPRRGPVIIAANHQSYYDPVMVTIAANRWITYMGHRRFFHYPVLGRLMRMSGCLPVLS